MNLKEFDLVEVNGNSFIILNVIESNSNRYLYLVNKDKEDDLAIVKVIEENGKVEFIAIDNDEEFELVLKKLVIANKEEIKKFYE